MEVVHRPQMGRLLTEIVDTLKYRGKTTVVASYRAAYDVSRSGVTLRKWLLAANYQYDWVDAFKQTVAG